MGTALELTHPQSSLLVRRGRRARGIDEERGTRDARLREARGVMGRWLVRASLSLRRLGTSQELEEGNEGVGGGRKWSEVCGTKRLGGGRVRRCAESFIYKVFLSYFPAVYCCDFDDKKVISGGGDGLIKVWDAQTGDNTLSLVGHTGEVVRSSVISVHSSLFPGEIAAEERLQTCFILVT